MEKNNFPPAGEKQASSGPLAEKTEVLAKRFDKPFRLQRIVFPSLEKSKEKSNS